VSEEDRAAEIAKLRADIEALLEETEAARHREEEARIAAQNARWQTIVEAAIRARVAREGPQAEETVRRQVYDLQSEAMRKHYHEGESSDAVDAWYGQALAKL